MLVDRQARFCVLERFAERTTLLVALCDECQCAGNVTLPAGVGAVQAIGKALSMAREAWNASSAPARSPFSRSTTPTCSG